MLIRNHQADGFTLIELLIGLAVLSIVLSQGVPALSQLVDRSHQTSAINRLAAHVNLARSEAVKRNSNTVLCSSSDARTCSRSAHWESGYILFSDLNANRELDMDETLIRSESEIEHPGMVILSSASRTRLTFRSTGLSPGANGTLTFCSGGQPKQKKALIISNSGRPRVSLTRPDGSQLSCG